MSNIASNPIRHPSSSSNAGKKTPPIKEETDYNAQYSTPMVNKKAKSEIFGTAQNAQDHFDNNSAVNYGAKSAIGYDNMATTAGKGLNMQLQMNKFKGMTQFRENTDSPNNAFGSNLGNRNSTTQKTFEIDSVSKQIKNRVVSNLNPGELNAEILMNGNNIQGGKKRKKREPNMILPQ